MISDTADRQAILVTEDIIVVSIEDKIYFSPTNNIDWQDITENLPEMFSTQKIIAQGDYIYVAENSGIWKISISDFFTNATEKFEINELYILPNPVSSIAYLSTNETSIHNAVLSIFSNTGQLIYFEKIKTLGERHPINLSNLPAGPYFIET